MNLNVLFFNFESQLSNYAILVNKSHSIFIHTGGGGGGGRGGGGGGGGGCKVRIT